MKRLICVVILGLLAVAPSLALADQPPPSAAILGGAGETQRLAAPLAVGTLWENGEWDGINAYGSANGDYYLRTADDFELDADCSQYAVERIRGQLAFLYGPQASAWVEIYADSGGAGPVDPPLYTFTTSTYQNLGYLFGDLPVAEYTFETPGLTLPAGRYWVSVGGIDSDQDFNYVYFATAGNGAIQLQEGHIKGDSFGYADWTPVSSFSGQASDFAFDLDGDCAVAQQPAQLTPSAATCQQYKNGAATDLNQVLYRTTFHNKISQVTPASFAYFSHVVAPSADAFGVTIAQSNNRGFPIVGTAGVTVFDQNCNALSPTTVLVRVNGDKVLINFPPGPAGREYYVKVKYSMYNLLYTAVAPPGLVVNYTFSTAYEGQAPFAWDSLQLRR